MGGYAGQVNLGLAAFFGCGVLVSHFLWVAGVPIYLAALVGGMAAVVLAGIIGLPTLRLRGIYFSIGTFALAEALRVTMTNIFPKAVYMPSSYLATYSYVHRYYFGLMIMIITLVTIYLVANSRLGLAMKAIRDDELAAHVTGVNVFKYKVLALLIGAALAGGVYAFLRTSFWQLSWVFNPLWTFEPLIAVAIGGIGTFIGPIIGSIFLIIL